MSQHPHIPDYASPRPSLVSPGLTHRGKTPRSGGSGFGDFGDEAPQHSHFQFNEYALDVSMFVMNDMCDGRGGADGVMCVCSIIAHPALPPPPSSPQYDTTTAAALDPGGGDGVQQ